jgi:hypothetical protein
MNKAIEHGKEHRKPYKGGKAFCCSCRNQGGCEWCLGNRMYKFSKENEKTLDKLKDYMI